MNKLQSLLARSFNTSVLEKSRYPWVDYLRGIAILLVVYRHVLIGLERSNLVIPQPLVDANMMFFSFRMPLFFILSGLFIGGSLLKRSLAALLKIKFENLLYPYLIWAFIQVTLQIALSSFTNANRTWEDYTYILYQPRALDQFWYLPALFNTTAIYLLVKVKLRLANHWQLVLGFVLYLISPYFEGVTMISDWMEHYLFFALGDSLATLFFQPKTQSFMRARWPLLAAIPFFAVTQWYYLQHPLTEGLLFLPISLIGCFTMFLLAYRFQEWGVLRFLRILGFHSLYIYVMHVLVSAFTRMILYKILGIHQPVILLFCGIAAGVIIPVIIYNLLIKDNIGWFLFSPVRKKGKVQSAV